MAAPAPASNDIAFSEFEWRNSAVLASANKTIVTIARQSKVAISHYQLVCSLRSLASTERELLNLLHSKEIILALEQAVPEQISSLSEKLLDSQVKTDEVISSIRALRLGFWEKVYRPYLLKLDGCTNELIHHARAFSNVTESALIMLSKGDQEHLLAALENPPEPNEALRRAFK
jgi:hypothetical protein